MFSVYVQGESPETKYVNIAVESENTKEYIQ